jgi:hypothetical protein
MFNEKGFRPVILETVGNDHLMTGKVTIKKPQNSDQNQQSFATEAGNILRCWRLVSICASTIEGTTKYI